MSYSSDYKEALSDALIKHAAAVRELMDAWEQTTVHKRWMSVVSHPYHRAANALYAARAELYAADLEVAATRKQEARLEELKLAGDVGGYYHNLHKVAREERQTAEENEMEAQAAYNEALRTANRLRADWEEAQRAFLA